VFDVDDVHEQVFGYAFAHCAHAAPQPTKGGEKEEKRDKIICVFS